MKQIDASSLSQILVSCQICLFDIRPPALIERETIPGARALSLEALQQGNMPELPFDTPIYLVCERGAVSELAGLYLETAGFSEVHNLVGGLVAWRAMQKAES
ncbi:MAG: rhodanese-like domain-containing protein [Trueperaceae bacterium]